MVCCTLRLRNGGGGALHGLRLAVGGPALHAGPTAAHLAADPLELMIGVPPPHLSHVPTAPQHAPAAPQHVTAIRHRLIVPMTSPGVSMASSYATNRSLRKTGD